MHIGKKTNVKNTYATVEKWQHQKNIENGAIKKAESINQTRRLETIRIHWIRITHILEIGFFMQIRHV